MSGELAELARHALGAAVTRATRVAGGDINDAYELTLSDGRRVFAKTKQRAPAGMYEREADGLAFLREANALRVPDVLAVSESALFLEWIGPGRRASDFDERLGRGLAALHRFGAPCFGHAHDNFIGSLAQHNAPLAGFAAFYVERRILPLVERAARAGHITTALRREFEKLCARMDTLVGPQEPPARLHGDLWSGNVHVDERGLPVLIDPAVYGGHREIDLAMLRLFGAPSARFFAAYDEVYPRAPGSEARVSLFQLYPLLVHLCLFGTAYLEQVERALAAYL